MKNGTQPHPYRHLRIPDSRPMRDTALFNPNRHINPEGFGGMTKAQIFHGDYRAKGLNQRAMRMLAKVVDGKTWQISFSPVSRPVLELLLDLRMIRRISDYDGNVDYLPTGLGRSFMARAAHADPSNSLAQKARMKVAIA